MYRIPGRPLTRSFAQRLILTNWHSRCSYATSSKICKDLNVGSRDKTVYTEKYSHKLQRMADKQGITVEALITRNREREKKERQTQMAQRQQLDQTTTTSAREFISADVSGEQDAPTPPELRSRQDSSPVKPLSSILNFDRLFSTPHTPEQVEALWNAYHVSRSGGTGRGYLSAIVPVDKYERMLSLAKPYKNFLLPLVREDAQVAQDDRDGTGQTPTEFFYLQWDFHGTPPDPKLSNDIFAGKGQPGLAAGPARVPPTSTILFTPLVEYQTHQSFATPYLVITHYTDLAQTHGIVLLRGEISPSNGHAGAQGTQYHLSQHHAMELALGVQKFYLWSGDSNERQELVKIFHERPEDFKWQDLLRLSSTTS